MTEMAFGDSLTAFVNSDEDRRNQVDKAIGEALNQADQIGQQIITTMAKLHHAAVEVEDTDSTVFTDEHRAILSQAIQARIGSLAVQVVQAASKDERLKERYVTLFGGIAQALTK